MVSMRPAQPLTGFVRNSFLYLSRQALWQLLHSFLAAAMSPLLAAAAPALAVFSQPFSPSFHLGSGTKPTDFSNAAASALASFFSTAASIFFSIQPCSGQLG